MRIAQRERRNLALHIGAVSGADDIQLARESGRHALHGIRGQRARQAVQRGVLVAIANDFESAVLLLERDSLPESEPSACPWALPPAAVADVDLHAFRQRDWLFSYS